MVCGMLLGLGVVVVQVEHSGRYQGHNVYLSTLTVPRVLSTNIAYGQTIFVIYLQQLLPCFGSLATSD